VLCVGRVAKNVDLGDCFVWDESTKCRFRRQCFVWDESKHYRCNIGEEQHQDLGHIEEYGNIPQTLAPLVTLVDCILQVLISYLSQDTSGPEWGLQYFSLRSDPGTCSKIRSPPLLSSSFRIYYALVIP
jgi:hypothetical protein